MILIITDEEDQSTNKVIDWLIYLDEKFVRVNPSTKVKFESIDITDSGTKVKLLFDNVVVDSENIKSIWYRRGFLKLPQMLFSGIHNQIKETSHLNNWLCDEISTVNELINHIFFDKNKNLCHPGSISLNKLEVLSKAHEFGLKVPATRIATDKSGLSDFANKYKSIVTKSLKNVVNYLDDKTMYTNYTELIPVDDLLRHANSFAPSLLQENIQKWFDVRVFYIDERFFSMAIFSQMDSQTKIDFRRYNNSVPNRSTKINLPIDLKNSVIQLMDHFAINTGSIDFVYSVNREFIFLEINPVGQYDMVSSPCNFYLDSEIAQFLSN